MKTCRSLSALILALVLLSGVILAPPRVAAQQSQMTWAVHISLAPTWFDPGRAHRHHHHHEGALRGARRDGEADARQPAWPRRWPSRGRCPRTGSRYEFVVRKGVVFHNGDSLTAEDVKFSFDRYRGAAAKLLKERVSAVEVVDPYRVRFRLKEPWPDFMTFYGTPATGAGWIVPKKYIEKVGDEGFKKAPVGAGPYRLVSFNPGVELVFEAHDRYWRKAPAVKRLVWKVGARGRDAARDAEARRGRHRVLAARPPWRGGEAHRGAQARPHRRSPPPSGSISARCSGTRSRPGTTGVSAWPPRWPSTRTPSTRRRRSASPVPPAASSRRPSSTRWPSRRIRTTRRRRRSSWPRPAIRTASTPGTTRATCPTGAWPRPSRTTWRRSASAPSCARWSGPPSSRQWKDKKITGILQAGAGRPGQRRDAASRTTWSRTASTRGAATRTWTTSSSSRRESWIPSAARCCSTRSSASLTSASWPRRSGSSGFLNAIGPRVEESGLGLIAYHPYSAPYEDLKLRK